jgi:hypothetical protein
MLTSRTSPALVARAADVVGSRLWASLQRRSAAERNGMHGLMLTPLSTWQVRTRTTTVGDGPCAGSNTSVITGLSANTRSSLRSRPTLRGGPVSVCTRSSWVVPPEGVATWEAAAVKSVQGLSQPAVFRGLAREWARASVTAWSNAALRSLKGAS